MCMYIHTYPNKKQANCIKRVQPSKSLGEKSCEIKNCGQEMAAMILTIENSEGRTLLYSLAIFTSFKYIP